VTVFFIGLLLAEISAYVIDKQGKSTIGTSGLDIFKAFMRLLLLNERDDLESILKNNLSERKRVKVTIIMFKRARDNSLKAVLILPRIHPGPFRNVGSSTLPSKVVRYLEKYGISAIILHRASTHNLDMVDNNEVDLLVKEMVKLIVNSEDISVVDVSFPLIRESEHYRCISQRFGKHLLAIASRKDCGMEDIPEDLEIDVNSRFKLKGYEIIVVDAHNSVNYEGENVFLVKNSRDYSELVELILKTAEELCQNKGCNLIKLGACRLRDKCTPLLGLGDEGVVSLTLATNGNILSLLIFDANNMIVGLRDCLVDRLRSYKLPITEVLTTDNHAIAGVLPRVKYYPLGLKISTDELLKMSKSVLDCSLRSLEEVRVSVKTIQREVNVLGQENFEKIRAFILSSARTVKLVLSSIPLGLIIYTLVILLT